MGTAENAVTRAVVEYLRRRGAWVQRVQSGQRGGTHYAEKGTPDWLGAWVDGRLLAVEIKRPGEKPSAVQLSVINRLRAMGAVAFWCDSVEMCAEALDTFAPVA